MNCLRKGPLLLSVLLALLLLPVSEIFAATTVSLSPTTGTIYSDTTAVSVLANSAGDEFYGADINVNFTGNVEYLSGTGASRCTSFKLTPGAGTVNVECLSLDHAPGAAYNGVIATLYFRSTGTGTSTFSLSSVDPDLILGSGATYTLSLEKNPNPVGSTSGLPKSGIFDDTRSVVIFGFILILFGMFFSYISKFTSFSFKKMGEGIVRFKEDVQEKKVSRRRNRVEKDF